MTADLAEPCPSASILVVDDTPANLTLLATLLSEQGYDVRVAPEGKLALQSARACPPDLILLDIRMPGMDGYQVCRELKADARLRAVPVIFLSALDAPQDKLSGFQAGGVDFVTKPFETLEVLARVSIHLRLSALQAELEEKNQALEQANVELQRLASTDPLTGLYNRRAILERSELCLHLARRYGAPYSLIMFDIDHFKAINDQHGHDVGDRVLLAMTDRVQQALRETDTLARWGGEEFLVLAPQSEGEETCRLAERLRELVAQSEIDPVAGRVTASFGVASVKDGDSLEAVVKRADQCLYAAKRNGRNRVECTCPEHTG